MIGKIKGTLEEFDGTVGLVQTASGVFYQMFLPPWFLTIELSSVIEVYTYLQVRDDALVLFGFDKKDSYKLFIRLISISGVGPKLSFTIVSFSSVDRLIEAVRENDLAYLASIPGLGKKTAMKIILELGQKLNKDFDISTLNINEDEKTILDALSSLGFDSQKGRKILKDIQKDLPLEEKIKEAIRLVSATR